MTTRSEYLAARTLHMVVAEALDVCQTSAPAWFDDEARELLRAIECRARLHTERLKADCRLEGLII